MNAIRHIVSSVYRGGWEDDACSMMLEGFTGSLCGSLDALAVVSRRCLPRCCGMLMYSVCVPGVGARVGAAAAAVGDRAESSRRLPKRHLHTESYLILVRKGGHC